MGVVWTLPEAMRKIAYILFRNKLLIAGCDNQVSFLGMSYVPLSIVISRKRASLPYCRTAAERIRLLSEIRQLAALRLHLLSRRQG